MKATASKIESTIKSSVNIAVICHKNPDGDALGSATALVNALDFWQKKHTLFCITPTPPNFDWLPHISEFKIDQSIITNNIFDTIIVLDSGSLLYAGIDDIINSLNYSHTIINIDHHNSNNYFGNINYVDEMSSSTCEIIYELLRRWKVPMNKDIATSLLNGIMTDTGMLTNPATSDKALGIASDLMKFGANIYKITQYNTRTKHNSLLNLWGVAMQRIIYNKNFNCVSTYITEKDFEQHKLNEGGLDGLANFLSSLSDVNFTMVLVKTSDGLIKGSLRTTRDDINVGALAQKLGGGGHKKASGFVIKGKLSYNNNEIEIV